jgi:hypothetical protein
VTDTAEQFLRALELHQLMADLANERRSLHETLLQHYPALGEGGSVQLGKIKIEGKLVRQTDASKWERHHLPKTSTNHLVKLKVTQEE